MASAPEERASRAPLARGSRTLSSVRNEQERKQNRQRSRLLAHLPRRIKAVFWSRTKLVDAVRLARLLDAPQGRSPVSVNPAQPNRSSRLPVDDVSGTTTNPELRW